MRVGSLFSGAGGFDMGFHAARFETAYFAEIDRAARAVLKYRWPDVPLFGDVRKLHGDALPDVDVLIGGSPCQDLSIAGRRQGLDGERSGLFYEQVRIWRESSAALLVWENVDGALSTNRGRDFALVLSAFVGADVVVPGGGWRSAGLAGGPAGVAAWRVLDARYFGVPQRRARVFVVCARAAKVDPAEILSLDDRVPRRAAPRRSARKATAGIPRGRDERAGGHLARQGSLAFRKVHRAASAEVRSTMLIADPISASEAGTYTHEGRNNFRLHNVILQPDVAGAVSAKWEKGTGGPAGDEAYNLVVAPTLKAQQHSGSQRGDTGDALIVGALDARHAGGFQSVRSAEAGHLLAQPFAFKPSHYTRGKDGAPTLVMPPLSADADKGDQDPLILAEAGAAQLDVDGDDCVLIDPDFFAWIAGFRVRRLTPRECERLMGWPDDWTLVPRGKRGKLLSDSARYRLCGNGVVLDVAAWIAFRLREALA